MIPIRWFSLAVAAMLIAALAPTIAGAAAAQPSESQPALQKPAAAQATFAQPADAPALSTDLFYRLLLGDIALQREHPDVAAKSYLDAARDAKDPRFAERATEIAIASRDRNLVHEAATLWEKLDPEAKRPKAVLAALAANGNRGAIPLSEATERMRERIARVLSEAALSGQGVGGVFLQLNALFSQHADAESNLALIADLAKPYPKSAEAHYAVALAAFRAGAASESASAVAVNEVDRALELEPEWDRAAVLKGEILGRKSPTARIEWLQSFLARSPYSKAATGALAQAYIDQHRLADARALMQKLWDHEPESRDLEFAVAGIALRMKDYPGAEHLFLDLKKAGYGDPGTMDLYLGELAEDQKHYATAIERYQAIKDGDRAWIARLRIGALYGKEGRLDEAKRWLAGLDAVTQEQKIQVKQAEAQVLREAGDDAGAYKVLEQGLAAHPDAPDLIYDLAMVAEKLDRVDEAETRLKHLVALKPNDAQALNALGYTLVDRTGRTNEGFALIERAHKLAPDDPFILDSMGWALYRLGRLDKAESYLQQALDGRSDPEIAAHLGEVLWRKGDRDRARTLWKTQLAEHPDNAVLKETVQRLEPQ